MTKTYLCKQHVLDFSHLKHKVQAVYIRKDWLLTAQKINHVADRVTLVTSGYKHKEIELEEIGEIRSFKNIYIVS